MSTESEKPRFGESNHPDHTSSFGYGGPFDRMIENCDFFSELLESPMASWFEYDRDAWNNFKQKYMDLSSKDHHHSSIHPVGSEKAGINAQQEEVLTVPVQQAPKRKKRVEVVINGVEMDISGLPIPVCSCTGAPQQCYRWGSVGWQSVCCTINLSAYPLPMSTKSKRRGARIAGRKMRFGAFKKVLDTLSLEGYNFSNPIDLRSHWAKHGTNMFVTMK